MNVRLILWLFGALLTLRLSAQTNPSASKKVEHAFFQRWSVDRGYAMCIAKDNNVYVATRRNDILDLVKMTPDGLMLFSTLIDLDLGPLDVVAEILIDSEGKLVGCGTFAEDAPAPGFVFRYDPATSAILWARRITGDNTVVNGVLENGEGGNYLVYANPHFNGGDDAEILEINRQTGALESSLTRRYHLGASDNFQAMVLDKTGLYAVGRYTQGDDYNDMRHALTRFDPATGQPVWSMLSPMDTTVDARLYGRDLVLDQGAVISTFSGNDKGDDLSATHVFLQKTTADGDLLWVKKYDLPDWSSEFAEELISVPDGYVLLGRALTDDQGWLFLLKTDKNGNPLWARRFEHEYNNDLIGAAQGQLLSLGNYLLFTGYMEHVSAGSTTLVVKTTADGLVSDACTALETVPVQAFDVPNAVNIPVDLELKSSSAVVENLNVPAPAPLPVVRLVICEKEIDDCQVLPDWVFKIDSFTCNDGRLDVHYTVCNQGGAAAASSIPLAIYRGNPITQAAPLLGVYAVSDALAPGACESGVIGDVGDAWFPNGVPGSLSVYAVINDNGSLAPPFSLNAFPVTGLPECNYDNNTSTSDLTLSSPPLELGSDVISCSGAPHTFDAGAGFSAYLWQDGSSSRTFTATTPGHFFVTVTDVCGFTQQDSVFYTFSLLTDARFPDTAVCPGAVLHYTVPGFSNYTWAPGNGLNCTNCATVTIKPIATTQYTLLASDNQGCVLKDTFLVQVLPQPVKNQTFEFCPGSSVTIGGQVYDQPGVVTETLASTTGGCDTIATYILKFVALPQPSVVGLQCPANISVTLPANATTIPVTYADPLASTNCPCGKATWSLVQGLASGAAFPEGLNKVCLQATDECGNTKSCCFTVSVDKPVTDEPCDVKNTPCIKFEILGIFQNPAKQKTYRMRVTNNCSGILTYVAFQLPSGFVADKPGDNAVYTSPAGRQYLVRNPNASPFPSIRFKSVATGIANGQSDVFEYTLPPQADPLFIHAIARLEPQAFYETHLNVFACEVQQVQNRPEGVSERTSEGTTTGHRLRVFPNPAVEALAADLSDWPDQPLRVQLYDAFGRLMLDQSDVPGGQMYRIDMEDSWPAGLYTIEVLTPGGERLAARFVRAR